MYRYDQHDRAVVTARAAEFRDQVRRRLDGALSEDQFRPLRLMNGVYLETHAYMLRVAIPYGVLSSHQLRVLAGVAREFDKGYGHFTTRQNIQFNWISLEAMPDILDRLAEAEMHAIQTSGACVRNVSCDPLAGVAGDEIADPRPWAEAIRQWSTLHPEFAYLPRKFKIAVSGGAVDRAAVRFHDIGLRLVRGGDDGLGFRVYVGGGLGRTPKVAEVSRDFVPGAELLGYLEAILRVYNLHGRRDNKFKARIKILLAEMGLDALRAEVEEEWTFVRQEPPPVPEPELARIAAAFAPPPLPVLADSPPALTEARRTEPAFAAWLDANVQAHKVPGHAAVTLSLKPVGGTPGDLTAEQMVMVADLADRYSQGELRTTKEQNLVLPHVRQDQLRALWGMLSGLDLAEPNRGRAGAVVCCPGLDYCSLANARSIPLAQELSRRLSEPARRDAIGPISLNISGCINACGHHHAGNLGVIGVDKHGAEAYLLVLGGDAYEETASVATPVGPAMSADQVVAAVDTVIALYLDHRAAGETFADTVRRLGVRFFKESLS